MGQELSQIEFSEADHKRFALRLEQCLSTLSQLVASPHFDPTPPSIGAELEMSLMHADGAPAYRNIEILEALQDKRFTAEIDRFNLEYNSTPLPFSNRPFHALGDQLSAALQQVRDVAREQNTRPITVGILPSLQRKDLGAAAMTPMKRYQVLSRILRQHRGRPFRIRIDGQDPLQLQTDCVTFEGANTSLQLHLKVRPESFVRCFNAAQMATGLAVAVSGNSPTFLQHRLWDETRIVVFKQAVDDRDTEAARHHFNARVGLGTDWWRGPVDQAFAQHLHQHDVLLPISSHETGALTENSEKIPALAEITTHGGTIWYWNRPVYDAAAGGHLRIEFRALPSGPTIIDMMANAALMIGLTLALAESGPDIDDFAFRHVEHNLYRAAHSGLDAELDWPCSDGHIRPQSARSLLQQWLPRAESALVKSGIHHDEAKHLLTVIDQRLGSGQTGARWQRHFLQQSNIDQDRNSAMHALVRRYADLSEQNLPVHTWPLA